MILQNHSMHVVDWLWRDGVPLAEYDRSASMEAHKAQFVEREPWYCVLGVYQAWRHTKGITVKALGEQLPVPF